MIPPQSREVWRGHWSFSARPKKLQWLEFEFLGQANSKPACGGGPDAVGAPGVDWQVGSSRARLSEDTSARLVLTRDPQRSCPQKPPGTAQEAAARKLGLHPGA